MIFITKGDLPLTDAQLANRTQQYIDSKWPVQARETAVRTADPKYIAAMKVWDKHKITNATTNTFNRTLAAYREAVGRLTVVQLSVGAKSKTMQYKTGETIADSTGKMIPVVNTFVTDAIAPLPATIAGFDNTDPANPVAAQVPNPAIVKDDAERAAAQAVVTATKASIVTFAKANLV
jgi:hypothetical protein